MPKLPDFLKLTAKQLETSVLGIVDAGCPILMTCYAWTTRRRRKYKAALSEVGKPVVDNSGWPAEHHPVQQEDCDENETKEDKALLAQLEQNKLIVRDCSDRQMMAIARLADKAEEDLDCRQWLGQFLEAAVARGS